MKPQDEVAAWFVGVLFSGLFVGIVAAFVYGCSSPVASPVDASAPDAPAAVDAAPREPGMVIPPHDAGPPNLFFPCDDDAAGCWPRICPPWCEEGNLPPERNQ